MGKRIVDVIPNIPQYEDIPYAGDFECPNCGMSGFYDFGHKHKKPNLIGWTETNIGLMGVFECPSCGGKFRFHTTMCTWIADKDEFDFYLHNYACRCANWEEIEVKLD